MNGRRVRFLADFDYLPEPRITVAYRKGQIEFVKLECAEKAIAAGKAEYVYFKVPNAGVGSKVKRKGAKNG